MAVLNKITNTKLKNELPDVKEKIVSDGGGLYVRIRSSKDGGAKSFRLKYKFDHKQKWLTIGSYPLMSLSDARVKRDEYKRMIKAGIDPTVSRAITKQKNIYQQRTKLSHVSAQNNQLTLDELFITFKKNHLVTLKDKGKYACRNYLKHVSPQIGELFVKEITRTDINKVIDIMRSAEIYCMAERVFTLIRQLYNFAIERGIVNRNPTDIIKKSSINPTKSERDRKLNDDEIKLLATKIPEAKLSITTEYAIWIILGTGCRISELIKNTWDNVDFENKTFFIPKSLSKNKTAHTISLSEFALHYFTQLKIHNGESHFLFPRKNNPNLHIDPKSITKQISDRQRADSSNKIAGRTKLINALKVGNEPWTPHDLRRTMATIMAKYKTPENIIDKCLNHVYKRGTTHVYIRYDYAKEMQEAWHKVGSHISKILELNKLIENKSAQLTYKSEYYDANAYLQMWN